MRLPLALGIAAAGLAFSAFAEPVTTEVHRIIMHHGGEHMPNPDTNHDGWLNRAEAAAMADHVFAELDTNHDGKLDASDHAHHHMLMRDGDSDDDAVTEHGGAHVERRIIIHRDDAHADAEMPAPPEPPEPPHPPMFMMLLANSEEADTNHDGALSLNEFRAQHLRFFDAGDVNGDGKVRFQMPEPPAPPAPPEPPRHP